jgi:hypothetical protein
MNEANAICEAVATKINEEMGLSLFPSQYKMNFVVSIMHSGGANDVSHNFGHYP